MYKRILITGANGFIGSNIIYELLANSTPVTALVREKSNIDYLKKIKCYNIIQTDNYLDPIVIRKLSMSKPEYIVHCAWSNNQLKDTKNLIKILELAKNIDCKGFITIGSYEEYGQLERNLSENTICIPKNSYGRSKHAFYMLTKEICASLDIKHIHLRLGIPYSNKKDSDFYFNDVIKKIYKDELVLLKNIYDVQDYIHTSDIARGIVSLINNDAEGDFNLSFGQGVEIKSVLNMIYEKLNKKFIFDESSSQNKKVFNLNINKIYNQSNWKPAISIWDGISLLIQEVKFENNPTLEQFTKRIRSLYK
ncbi:NAD(P)-dependent oxidoreductase [Alphaproteobacteria bacterium]|nr:NAD(P)-dependent oxidoreductase [Alphaproteobacteria bacterium]